MKKTTSKDLSKKLKRYSALTIAVSGIANLNAQDGWSGIIDYTIDSSTSNRNYAIDAYGSDGNPEFSFYVNASFAWVLTSNTINTGSILGSSSLGFAYPYALTSGQSINNAQITWFSNSISYQSLMYINSSSSCVANWCGVSSQFLGLRFHVGSDLHYGWARISASPNGGVANTLTIHEYYFNPTANEGVEAGQFALGIEEETISKTKIIALNKTIALYNLPDQTNYRVFNMSGQQILDGKIQNEAYVIEANTLANGIYIIELQDNDTKALIRKK
ncbi:MAG TPA: T9SS type A sorting domain-containing protein, partial [Flavobacteriaceae bacterium]|nr:T9SS type A sorting domain-containing protein [Flavobacteriaceae bacterium]